MNTTTIAIALGLLLGAGLWMIILGIVPGPVRETRAPSWRPRGSGGGFIFRHKRALVIGAMTGLVLGVLSGWYVLIAILPAAAVGLPPLVRAPKASKEVQVLADIETWVRGLSGILVGGAVGLEQAMRASVGSAPDSIRPGLARLVARLDAQQPIKPTLLLWADEMALHAVDIVAATLILESERREGGIAKALEELAEAMADQTQARRQIETDRSSTRSTARWVTIISISTIGLISVFTNYMDEYTTPVGQVAALVLASLYGGCLLWMHRISLGRPTPRFLPATAERTGS